VGSVRGKRRRQAHNIDFHAPHEDAHAEEAEADLYSLFSGSWPSYNPVCTAMGCVRGPSARWAVLCRADFMMSNWSCALPWQRKDRISSTVKKAPIT
jgi:hypothetical protein